MIPFHMGIRDSNRAFKDGWTVLSRFVLVSDSHVRVPHSSRLVREGWASRICATPLLTLSLVRLNVTITSYSSSRNRISELWSRREKRNRTGADQRSSNPILANSEREWATRPTNAGGWGTLLGSPVFSVRNEANCGCRTGHPLYCSSTETKMKSGHPAKEPDPFRNMAV